MNTQADSVTVQVIHNYLLSAAREMSRNLTRTSYNTIVYEIHDFGLGIYDRQFRLLAEAPGLAIFTRGNDYGLQKMVEYLGEENIHPGDLILLNYPYWSSAHVLDVMATSPIFHKDKLLGFTAVKIHWLDLSQKDAGYCLDTTDVFQEGLKLPCVKILERGVLNKGLQEIIRFNSRLLERTLGDMNAQISSCRTGERRVQELIEKFGPPMPTFTIWTRMLAIEVVTKALAKGMPDILPACSGGDVFGMIGLGMNPRNNMPWLESTNEPVGFGAHAGGDGDNGRMHLSEPGCRNNPVEVLETKAPMLIERYGYRVDSGGAGKYRGGLGVARAYRFLAPCTAITLVKKTKTRPWGMAKGKDGLNGQILLRPGTKREAHVGGIYEHMTVGDVMINQSGGGGGWGNPFERAVAAVLDDVRNGFITAESAQRDYGVVLDAKHQLDATATAKLRSKQKPRTAKRAKR